jgi:hypothetical protein
MTLTPKKKKTASDPLRDFQEAVLVSRVASTLLSRTIMKADSLIVARVVSKVLSVDPDQVTEWSPKLESLVKGKLPFLQGKFVAVAHRGFDTEWESTTSSGAKFRVILYTNTTYKVKNKVRDERGTKWVGEISLKFAPPGGSYQEEVSLMKRKVLGEDWKKEADFSSEMKDYLSSRFGIQARV